MDLVEFVDEILESQDKNNDGYIDFPEFSSRILFPQDHKARRGVGRFESVTREE